VSVERPSPLLDALAGDARAREVFDGLFHTHRREYARWVDEAEREPTRLARATNAVAMPRDGVHRKRHRAFFTAIDRSRR
jgi:uncharacterized protein YdeI (YjbR/CyaY-like superfamily)